MKYQIVSSTHLVEIEYQVNDLMAEGWVPHGGVMMLKDPSYKPVFYQAMIGPSRVGKARRCWKK